MAAPETLLQLGAARGVHQHDVAVAVGHVVLAPTNECHQRRGERDTRWCELVLVAGRPLLVRLLGHHATGRCEITTGKKVAGSIDGKGSHGGYCGLAVKPIALNMVAEIARDKLVLHMRPWTDADDQGAVSTALLERAGTALAAAGVEHAIAIVGT